MRLEICSRGLLSNWAYCHDFHTLFDCGDGFSSYIDKRANAVKHVFISHSHLDHVSSLAAFLGLRRVGTGTRNSPINIYYHAGDVIMKRHIRLIRDTQNTENIKFIAAHVGRAYPIDKLRYVVPFKTNHTSTSLGYNLCEIRHKLNPKYDHIPKDQIGKMVHSGEIDKNDIRVKYEAKLLTYALDNNGYDPKDIQDTELLITDATFLSPLKDDNEELVKVYHATLDYAIELADRARAKKVVYAHISTRYGTNEIEEARKKLKRHERILDPHKATAQTINF